MKKILFSAIFGGMILSAAVSVAQERLPEYLQAEKFTENKLKNMLFLKKALVSERKGLLV